MNRIDLRKHELKSNRIILNLVGMVVKFWRCSSNFLTEYLFRKTPPDIDWEMVYKFLGMSAEYAEYMKSVSLSDVRKKEKLWNMPVIRGITCEKIKLAFSGLKINIFVSRRLDDCAITNDRNVDDGSYLVSFYRRVEADYENRNISANKLKEQKKQGITFLERLLLELGYVLTTGLHLDNKAITLCEGSRDKEGFVIHVSWELVHNTIFVCCHSLNQSFNALRSRSVIYLFP